MLLILEDCLKRVGSLASVVAMTYQEFGAVAVGGAGHGPGAWRQSDPSDEKQHRKSGLICFLFFSFK